MPPGVVVVELPGAVVLGAVVVEPPTEPVVPPLPTVPLLLPPMPVLPAVLPVELPAGALELPVDARWSRRHCSFCEPVSRSQFCAAVVLLGVLLEAEPLVAAPEEPLVEEPAEPLELGEVVSLEPTDGVVDVEGVVDVDGVEGVVDGAEGVVDMDGVEGVVVLLGESLAAAPPLAPELCAIVVPEIASSAEATATPIIFIFIFDSPQGKYGV